MVISGSMAVRTMQEFTVVKKGDVLFFERRNGAHQFYKHTDQLASISMRKVPTGWMVYPDSGKLMISKLTRIQNGERVSYFDDEENVEENGKISCSAELLWKIIQIINSKYEIRNPERNRNKN